MPCTICESWKDHRTLALQTSSLSVEGPHRARDGRRLTHSFLVAQEGLMSVFFQGIFKSDLVQKDVQFQRCWSQEDRTLSEPWEMASGSWGNALMQEDSRVPGVASTGEKAYVLGTDDYLKQQRNHLLWSGLHRYFVTHPAGTFICIYSSWLTCHSPSSNVSIPGTVIYRVIDSRAPRGLPCQWLSSCGWSPPRGRSALPTWLSIPLGTAWQSEGPAPQAVYLHLWFFLPLGVTQRAPGSPATGQVQMVTTPSLWLQINTKAAITSPSLALHRDVSHPLSIVLTHL